MISERVLHGLSFVLFPFDQKFRFASLEISSGKWDSVGQPRELNQFENFLPDISVPFDFHLGIFG